MTKRFCRCVALLNSDSSNVLQVEADTVKNFNCALEKTVSNEIEENETDTVLFSYASHDA